LIAQSLTPKKLPVLDLYRVIPPGIGIESSPEMRIGRE